MSGRGAGMQRLERGKSQPMCMLKVAGLSGSGAPMSGRCLDKPEAAIPRAPWETPIFHHGDSRLHQPTTCLCTLRMSVARATRLSSIINDQAIMEVQWTRNPGTQQAEQWPSMAAMPESGTREHGYRSSIDGVPCAGEQPGSSMRITKGILRLVFSCNARSAMIHCLYHPRRLILTTPSLQLSKHTVCKLQSSPNLCSKLCLQCGVAPAPHSHLQSLVKQARGLHLTSMK